MIIDCHCHAGRGDALTAPWNTDAPLEAYLRRARKAGITHTIVFPAFHSDYVVANRELARLVAARRDRLIGFAMVHCGRDAGRFDASASAESKCTDTSISPLANCAKRRADCEFRCSLMSEAKRT